jgi:hypothetical protein
MISPPDNLFALDWRVAAIVARAAPKNQFRPLNNPPPAATNR